MDVKSVNTLSRLFGLLSEPNRLKIILALGKGKKSVSEIINETALSQPLVSFHLRTLRESGILSAERKATLVFYSVTEPKLIDLLYSLGAIPVAGTGHDKDRPGCMWPPMHFMRAWMKGGK